MSVGESSPVSETQRVLTGQQIVQGLVRIKEVSVSLVKPCQEGRQQNETGQKTLVGQRSCIIGTPRGARYHSMRRESGTRKSYYARINCKDADSGRSTSAIASAFRFRRAPVSFARSYLLRLDSLPPARYAPRTRRRRVRLLGTTFVAGHPSLQTRLQHEAAGNLCGVCRHHGSVRRNSGRNPSRASRRKYPHSVSAVFLGLAIVRKTGCYRSGLQLRLTIDQHIRDGF